MTIASGKLSVAPLTEGSTLNRSTIRSRTFRRAAGRSTSLALFPEVLGTASSGIAVVDSAIDSSTGIEWRQYVPLAVSFGVITDILLGSPLANAMIGLIRPSEDSPKSRSEEAAAVDTKERIDTRRLARQAIEKAQNTLELRQYLDKMKTDSDRMEDLKRKMDQQTAQLDQKLQERREQK